MSTRAWVTLALAGLIGCTTPLGITRDSDALIQTRALSYTLTPRFEDGLMVRINFTFENRTDEPASMVNCGGVPNVLLEKRVAGEWVGWSSRARFACLSPPITVESGDRWTGQLALEGGAPDCNCAPKILKGDPEGTYRIVIRDLVHEYDDRSPPWGRPLPLGQRLSNRFRIRLP